MLTPFDDLLWELRIAASQVSAARTDWDRVASGSPGHEIRRHLARCADAIGQARAEIARQRRPPPWWREEVEQSLRAARRLIVRQQIACFGRWWPPGRRYLG